MNNLIKLTYSNLKSNTNQEIKKGFQEINWQQRKHILVIIITEKKNC